MLPLHSQVNSLAVQNEFYTDLILSGKVLTTNLNNAELENETNITI